MGNVGLSTTPVDSSLSLSDDDAVATMLRYPELMFPPAVSMSTYSMTPNKSGALRLLRQTDNMRAQITALTSSEYNKRSLKVGTDVTSNIVNFAKSYNGFQVKGEPICSKEFDTATGKFKVATTPGLGPADAGAMAKMINRLYNEAYLPTGELNPTGGTLPPFIFVYIDDTKDSRLIEFAFDDDGTGGDLDWSAFKVHVNVPGYVRLGDIFVDNSMRMSYDDSSWGTRNVLRYPPIIMFARQELCLVGTGTLISSTDMGMQRNVYPRGLYMFKTDNALYQPMGIFTSSTNNVAVLKCAFKTSKYGVINWSVSGDEGAINTHRLGEYSNVMNARYQVSTGYEKRLECCKTFKEIMENMITQGIAFRNNETATVKVTLPDAPRLFPGKTTTEQYAALRLFFTSLCDEDPTVAGYLPLCDCIKPYKQTLAGFRASLGYTADDSAQVVSFACNTKACIFRDVTKVINLGDVCPTVNKPRVCISKIKLTSPASTLYDVCYNCDLTSTCATEVPIVTVTETTEPLVCGYNADGTPILCTTSNAVKSYTDTVAAAAVTAANAASTAATAKAAAQSSLATVTSAKTASDTAAAAATTAATAAAAATAALRNAQSAVLALTGAEKTTADALIATAINNELAARTSSTAAATDASAALAAYTALSTAAPAPVAPAPTAIGVDTVRFYTDKIATLKAEVAAAALIVTNEKTKALASTATVETALSAKTNSLIAATTTENSALASAAALISANAEKNKLTAAADISAATALVTTATADDTATQTAAAQVTADVLSISNAYDALRGAADASGAIPLQTVRNELTKVSAAKVTATTAVTSALTAKDAALTATSLATINEAVATVRASATTAATAYTTANKALTDALAAFATMTAGDAKATASALIETAREEVAATQVLATSAASALEAAEAAAAAYLEDNPDEAPAPTDGSGWTPGKIAGAVIGVLVGLGLVGFLLYLLFSSYFAGEKAQKLTAIKNAAQIAKQNAEEVVRAAARQAKELAESSDA